MKKELFLYILCAVGIIPMLWASDEKDVWLFPPSSYTQSIDKYREVDDFNEKYAFDFASARKHGGPYYPFIVADARYIYLREGRPGLRIDRTSIRTGPDGFQTFPEGSNRWVIILGGGYYASNRPYPSDEPFFIAYFKHLREARDHLLAGKLESVYWALFDTALILPQVIKRVRMSAPFLEETIRGVKHRYDDDMLLYRWFYRMHPGSANVDMYFINDPTPMVEGVPGNGVGLTLDIDYHIPSDNLVVLNGFVDWERRHLYKLNARMKRVLVTGEGFEFEYEFEDYVHFAQIDFPKKVQQVRLRVLEVYEGKRWADLAISGLFTNPDVLNTRNSPLAYELLEEAEREVMGGR